MWLKDKVCSYKIPSSCHFTFYKHMLSKEFLAHSLEIEIFAQAS